MARCRRCRVVFTSPLPQQDEALARYSEDYFTTEYLPSYGVAPEIPDLAPVRQHFAPYLDAMEPKRKLGRLLDVGAGVGLFLAVARERDWKVTGVEIAEPACRYAAERLDLPLFCGTIEQAGLDDESFDVVAVLETVEHVLDPVSLLSHCYRVLRPGGVLYLSTPNYDSLSRRLIGARWGLISPEEHIFLFNRRSLTRVLHTAGFVGAAVSSTPTCNPCVDDGGSTQLAAMISRALSRRPLSELLAERFLGDGLVATADKDS